MTLIILLFNYIAYKAILIIYLFLKYNRSYYKLIGNNY